jgi:hypothetical protein
MKEKNQFENNLKKKIKNLEKQNLTLRLKLENVLEDKESYKTEKDKHENDIIQNDFIKLNVSSKQSIEIIKSFTCEHIYEVDLTNNTCSCPSFKYNNHPYKNKTLDEEKTKCKHLNYCYEKKELKKN